MNNKYDIIVIGGGHAGIEAAWVSANMGCNTLLLTMDTNTIGRPSCNPSIGGSAKGHLVKEIDALGGVIGLLADKAGIQFKMLNKSKGPAIWSPRCQIDKDLYPIYAYQLLLNTNNLSVVNATANEIIIQNHKVVGVITKNNETIYSKTVIFCSGTFLNGLMFVGDRITKGGRYGEDCSYNISDKLKEHGLEVKRLKTGTPPRIKQSSINYSELEPSYGDAFPEPFSYKTAQVMNRILCYSTETNLNTHEELRKGFELSPLFTGVIKGTGPRYCPSIEDKVARFADRDSHKILLEIEGLNTDSVYINGFSTSLPEQIQINGIHTLPGLHNAEFIRPGYAIEYDYFPSYQINYTLENKLIEGLYTAGQTNGTSGYEEAAAQGLIAGINAVLKLQEKEEFILQRSESYIGVLIDDLVNKVLDEPYRIFTSLAEYRLLLRQDNADIRLMKYGHKFGLIPEQIYSKVNKKYEYINRGIELSKSTKLKAEQINRYFDRIEESSVKDSTDLYSLTKRSKVQLIDLLGIVETPSEELEYIKNNTDIVESIQTEIKYEGYIKRQEQEVKYFIENEQKKIPKDFDYNILTSLSNEAREKLNKIKPESLGQASRISGVSASDVSIISIYLK